MFCSKCGKTLPLDVRRCPTCGLPVGESRFSGSPYTSAQAHVVPGRDTVTGVYEAEPEAYTRTTYTSNQDAADVGDTDTRTTYRPVFESASVPEDIRRDMRAEANGGYFEDEREYSERELNYEDLSEETRETLDDIERELQPDQRVDFSVFRAAEIESEGQKGISPDVSEYIQKLEADQNRRTSRRRRIIPEYIMGDDVEGETVEGEEPVRARRFRRRTTEYAATYDENAEAVETDDNYITSESYVDDDVAVFDGIDDDEFDELRHSTLSLKQIFKISVAVVVIAAVFVGCVMWFRHIRENQSSAPIENVTETLYTEGIALIKEHASTNYVDSMLAIYKNDGLLSMSTKIQQGSESIEGLMPAEPKEHDELFIAALQSIESNIANCITSDALALNQNSPTAVSDSTERWTIVSNAITQLEAATSAVELTGIVNGERVDLVNNPPEPSPTPTVNYNTLSKGDKNNDVLDMQNRLYELGYLLGDRDGNFGNQTQTAVKMFQQDAGLVVTGIADNETLQALYADDAPRTYYAQGAA